MSSDKSGEAYEGRRVEGNDEYEQRRYSSLVRKAHSMTGIKKNQDRSDFGIAKNQRKALSDENKKAQRGATIFKLKR